MLSIRMTVIVGPISGGRVASFAHAILAQITYLGSIDEGADNRQVLYERRLRAMAKGLDAMAAN